MIWNIEADAQGITRIRDGRCGGADLLNGKGECGRILYTLREEDVRRLPKPDLTPHAQHTVLPAPTEITAARMRRSVSPLSCAPRETHCGCTGPMKTGSFRSSRPHCRSIS